VIVVIGLLLCLKKGRKSESTLPLSSADVVKLDSMSPPSSPSIAHSEKPRDTHEDEDYLKGMRHLEAGDNSRAVQRFLRYLRNNPTSGEAHYWVGMAYHRRGDLAKAEEHYKAGLEIWPDYAAAYYRLGSLYEAQDGHKQEAADAYRRYISLGPEGSDVAKARARLQTLTETTEPDLSGEAEGARYAADIILGRAEAAKPSRKLTEATEELRRWIAQQRTGARKNPPEELWRRVLSGCGEWVLGAVRVAEARTTDPGVVNVIAEVRRSLSEYEKYKIIPVAMPRQIQLLVNRRDEPARQAYVLIKECADWPHTPHRLLNAARTCDVDIDRIACPHIEMRRRWKKELTDNGRLRREFNKLHEDGQRLFVLLHLGQKEKAPSILRFLAEDAVPALSAAIIAADSRLKRKGLLSIVPVPLRDKLFANVLRSSYPEAKHWILSQLHQFSPQRPDPDLISALQRVAKDKDSAVRNMAGQILYKLSPSDAEEHLSKQDIEIARLEAEAGRQIENIMHGMSTGPGMGSTREGTELPASEHVRRWRKRCEFLAKAAKSRGEYRKSVNTEFARVRSEEWVLRASRGRGPMEIAEEVWRLRTELAAADDYASTRGEPLRAIERHFELIRQRKFNEAARQAQFDSHDPPGQKRDVAVFNSTWAPFIQRDCILQSVRLLKDRARGSVGPHIGRGWRQLELPVMMEFRIKSDPPGTTRKVTFEVAIRELNGRLVISVPGSRPRSDLVYGSSLAGKWTEAPVEGVCVEIQKMAAKAKLSPQDHAFIESVKRLGDPVVDDIKRLVSSKHQIERKLAIEILGDVSSVHSVGALEGCGDGSAIGVLRDVAGNQRCSPGARAAAVHVLGTFGRRSVGCLTELLYLKGAVRSSSGSDSATADVQRLAASELAKSGPAAVPELIEFLKNAGFSQDQCHSVGHCIHALGQIGDPRAQDVLRSFSNHPEGMIRREATRALEACSGNKR
jgi:HEAT repeat protein